MSTMTKTQLGKVAITPIVPVESIEEESQFWDSRSVVDEIDQGTLPGFHHARKTGSLTVRFQPEDIQRIREPARQHGIGIGPTLRPSIHSVL